MWSRFYGFKNIPSRGFITNFVRDTDGVTAIDVYRATYSMMAGDPGPFPHRMGSPVVSEMFETQPEAESWASARVKILLGSQKLRSECHTWDEC